MFFTLRACAIQPRQPLIQFIGKRQWPSAPGASHPHPAAPPEFQHNFAHFIKKRQSLGSTNQHTSTSVGARSKDMITYSHFWEAPLKYQRPRVREIGEIEMEAVMSGGASSYGRI